MASPAAVPAPSPASSSGEGLIWPYAFGYFAAYVPYSALTKAVTDGRLGERLGNFELLPASVVATTVTMFAILTFFRLWRYATHSRWLGVDWPRPTRFTLVSGMCAGLIIVTTTLAYAIDGVSIVFAMLLMRGGMMVMAPVVDALGRRSVRWFSWAGLAFALLSLVVAFALEPVHPGTPRFAFNALLVLDVTAYLAAYFFRLRYMSRFAKSPDRAVTLRYFVEEQMVAAPTMLVALAVLALVGGVPAFEQLRLGFVAHWTSPIIWAPVAIGVFSELTGVFGPLVLLDARENTFAVPVNRIASVLAGVAASLALYALYRVPAYLKPHEMAGAGVIVVAILFLTVPPALEKRRKAAAS